MDQRNACLVLKTSDLTAGSTTNIGSMDTVRKSMTWFNIDLRTVLGDLYDMYDLLFTFFPPWLIAWSFITL